MRYIALILAIFLLNCSAIPSNPYKKLDSAASSLLEPITKPSQGFIITAALIELNSNFSSLIYDKTDASYKDYVYSDYGNHLLYDKFKYYILPEKITKSGEISYNETVKTIIERVIIVNKVGEVVHDPKKADFIIFTSVSESFEKKFGENSVDMEISILDKSNKPIMFTKVKAISRSDENFFYFPAKSAKSVKYLTVKGLEYLMNKSFSKLFLEG